VGTVAVTLAFVAAAAAAASVLIAARGVGFCSFTVSGVWGYGQNKIVDAPKYSMRCIYRSVELYSSVQPTL